jgi:predicted TIM-barrel fold metal-dependent hydrolase
MRENFVLWCWQGGDDEAVSYTRIVQVHKARPLFPFLLLLSLLSKSAPAASPIADVHTHYKWSQTDVTPPEQVLATLEQHDVEFAVVIGTPAELALELVDREPQKLLAVWSPYLSGGDWFNWAYDLQVLQRARAAMASGRYQGIGELHLIGGFAPRPSSEVIRGLFELAASHDVPILLHTEFSREDYLVQLCREHPETRILWAHAGALLKPDQVERVLSDCTNVWAELSARDPWRFVNNPVTAADGSLLGEWRTLIERYQDRFMIGSDPVWPVDQMDRWDEADTGWREYARFIDFHRRWLSTLEPTIAEKIRWRNALIFFKRLDKPVSD